MLAPPSPVPPPEFEDIEVVHGSGVWTIVGSVGEDFNNLGVSPPSKLLGFACKQGMARPRTELEVPCLTDARRMPCAASVSENCVPSNVQIDLREEVLGRQFGEWSFASLLPSRWLRTRLTHCATLHNRLHHPHFWSCALPASPPKTSSVFVWRGVTVRQFVRCFQALWGHCSLRS